jgi:hypothetical protein
MAIGSLWSVFCVAYVLCFEMAYIFFTLLNKGYSIKPSVLIYKGFE